MAMSNAERQRRYRERRTAGEPVRTYVRPKDRRSRPQRWRDAVAELVTLQAEYQVWLDSLPETQAGSATAGLLETITALDLSGLEAVRPPKGFGRD